MPLPAPNRNMPDTLDTGPPGPSGAAYADKVAAEVEALWNRVVNLLGGVGGTANAITAVCTPPLIAAYQPGQVFVLVPAANNAAGAVTIDIDGRGAVAIQRNNGAALAANDLVAGQATLLQFFAGAPGAMRLMNPTPAQFGGAVALSNISVFTASGTWNKPAGLHHVVVHIVGGAATPPAAWATSAAPARSDRTFPRPEGPAAVAPLAQVRTAT